MHWTWLLVATLARLARIQGTVRLAKTNGAVTLLVGHPILFPTAFQATEFFPPLPGPVTIPITNKFETSLRRPHPTQSPLLGPT